MAAVVLCGIVHAGGRYFYCEAFGLTLSDPCVRAAEHGSSECPLAGLQPLRGDCCAIVVFRAMPDSAAAAHPQVPPARAATVLPVAPPVQDDALRADRSLRVALRRWRVPPKPPGEARAQLMVFLI